MKLSFVLLAKVGKIGMLSFKQYELLQNKPSYMH